MHARGAIGRMTFIGQSEPVKREKYKPDLTTAYRQGENDRKERNFQ